MFESSWGSLPCPKAPMCGKMSHGSIQQQKTTCSSINFEQSEEGRFESDRAPRRVCPWRPGPQLRLHDTLPLSPCLSAGPAPAERCHGFRGGGGAVNSSIMWCDRSDL